PGCGDTGSWNSFCC
ncbi:gallidermin family lantibiotic, partial [Bacillus sp. T_4]|nr:gallidermin family lantibiotic [Bacillus sp. T_4]